MKKNCETLNFKPEWLIFQSQPQLSQDLGGARAKNRCLFN